MAWEFFRGSFFLIARKPFIVKIEIEKKGQSMGDGPILGIEKKIVFLGIEGSLTFLSSNSRLRVHLLYLVYNSYLYSVYTLMFLIYSFSYILHYSSFTLRQFHYS